MGGLRFQYKVVREDLAERMNRQRLGEEKEVTTEDAWGGERWAEGAAMQGSRP